MSTKMCVARGKNKQKKHYLKKNRFFVHSEEKTGKKTDKKENQGEQNE